MMNTTRNSGGIVQRLFRYLCFIWILHVSDAKANDSKYPPLSDALNELGAELDNTAAKMLAEDELTIKDVSQLRLLAQRAELALSDGVPQLAVEDLASLFEIVDQQKSRNLPQAFSEEERSGLQLNMLEALVRSEAYLEAINFAQENVSKQPQARYFYWLAQAQIGLQRWRAARDSLRKAANTVDKQEDLSAWIALAQAQVMAVVARPESEVEAIVNELLIQDNQALRRSTQEFAQEYFFNRGRLERVEELLLRWAEINPQLKQLWQARIAQARGQQAQAILQLENLLALEGQVPGKAAVDLSLSIQAQAVLSLAQSYHELGQVDRAENLLLRELSSRPNNPLLAAQVLLLGELPWLQSIEAESTLAQWQLGAAPSLRMASIYLQSLRAQANSNWEQARTLFTRLWNQEEGMEGRELRWLAGLNLSQNYARLGDLDQALAILQELQKSYPEQALELEKRSFVLFLRAQVSLKAGNRQKALQLLSEVQAQEGLLAEELAWNQALINLKQPLGTPFVQALTQVQLGEQGDEKASKLRLEALVQAIERNEADQILSLMAEFAQLEANNQQLTLALLYASRWALAQDAGQIDLELWLGWLSQANPPQEEQIRELGEMRVRLALHEGETQRALEIYDSLLAALPNDEQLEGLRLQLGQALFLGGDFAGALLQYDLFLRNKPDAESAHLARYGAALATLQLPTEDALVNAVQRLGVIVADKDSPFRIDALLYQAYALQRMGDLSTAAEILRQALDQEWAQARSGELKNTLSELEFVLGGEAREAALIRWQSIQQDQEVPLNLREQAMWNHAQARETLGEENKALRLYREAVLGLALEQDKQADNAKWFHACVESGLSLLERQEKWAAAAAFLERAASRLEEDQGAAYRERAEVIRMLHFVERDLADDE